MSAGYTLQDRAALFSLGRMLLAESERGPGTLGELLNARAGLRRALAALEDAGAAATPTEEDLSGEWWAAERARRRRAEAALARCRSALETISKGEGPFSRDHLTHAENTIEAMKRTAREALATAEAAPEGCRPGSEGGTDRPPAPACAECRLWERGVRADPEDEGSRSGWCHRYAPPPVFWRWGKDDTPMDGVETAEPRWPRTACDDWCGEFQPRPT